MAGEKSRLQIWMDFQKARAQAEKLEEAAKNIRRESGRFSDCRAEVASAWEGSNATKFTGKMGIVSEDLKKIAAQLEKTAGVIRKNAKNLYDAEMEAKRIADLRNHS